MITPKSLFLLHFTGPERPDSIAAVTNVLAKHAVEVLEVDQSVIQGMLLLGLVIALSGDNDRLLNSDLEAVAGELGLTLRTTAVAEAQAAAQQAQENAPRMILTLLARKIAAAQISAVCALLVEQGVSVHTIKRLSQDPRLASAEGPTRACLEFSIVGSPKDEEALRASLIEITHREAVDLAWQHDAVYRYMHRLVAFDMDSTLIRQEVIDELAKEAGTGEEVSKITESAMRGEIDFDESLSRRVKLLEGLDIAALERVADRLVLTEGAELLLKTLKRYGFKTAILSGGFTHFGQILQRKLGVDYVHANVLGIEDGKLTGKVIGPIVNAQRKADLLREIAAKEGISLEQTIAVGDGANDLRMLAAAGMGIAFHAKPLVAKSSRYKINCLGLDGILYLIGLRDRDFLEQELAK